MALGQERDPPNTVFAAQAQVNRPTACRERRGGLIPVYLKAGYRRGAAVTPPDVLHQGSEVVARRTWSPRGHVSRVPCLPAHREQPCRRPPHHRRGCRRRHTPGLLLGCRGATARGHDESDPDHRAGARRPAHAQGIVCVEGTRGTPQPDLSPPRYSGAALCGEGDRTDAPPLRHSCPRRYPREPSETELGGAGLGRAASLQPRFDPSPLQRDGAYLWRSQSHLFRSVLPCGGGSMHRSAASDSAAAPCRGCHVRHGRTLAFHLPSHRVRDGGCCGRHLRGDGAARASHPAMRRHRAHRGRSRLSPSARVVRRGRILIRAQDSRPPAAGTTRRAGGAATAPRWGVLVCGNLSPAEQLLAHCLHVLRQALHSPSGSLATGQSRELPQEAITAPSEPGRTAGPDAIVALGGVT